MMQGNNRLLFLITSVILVLMLVISKLILEGQNYILNIALIVLLLITDFGIFFSIADVKCGRKYPELFFVFLLVLIFSLAITVFEFGYAVATITVATVLMQMIAIALTNAEYVPAPKKPSDEPEAKAEPEAEYEQFIPFDFKSTFEPKPVNQDKAVEEIIKQASARHAAKKRQPVYVSEAMPEFTIDKIRLRAKKRKSRKKAKRKAKPKKSKKSKVKPKKKLKRGIILKKSSWVNGVQRVARLRLKKKPGYFYYIDKQGDVSRQKISKKRKK